MGVRGGLTSIPKKGARSRAASIIVRGAISSCQYYRMYGSIYFDPSIRGSSVANAGALRERLKQFTVIGQLYAELIVARDATNTARSLPRNAIRKLES